jgi:DeoR family transcriptional regulator of aga operon
LHLIRQRERVSIELICEEFSVSSATARRDLDALVERGLARRIRGGAMAVQLPPPDLPAIQRETEQGAAKRRIGQAAAKLISPGETVFLSSGTTALEVARSLRDIPGLTVITNSLLVLNTLADAERITLVGLGGVLRRSEMSFIGHVTEQMLAEVRADKIFLGVRAIDAEFGLTNDFMLETMTDRAILKIGRELIVVADHTKCGRVGPAFVAPVNAVHTLITDTETPAQVVDAFGRRGVRVLVC